MISIPTAFGSVCAGAFHIQAEKSEVGRRAVISKTRLGLRGITLKLGARSIFAVSLSYSFVAPGWKRLTLPTKSLWLCSLQR